MYWIIANVLAIFGIPILVLGPLVLKDARSPTRMTAFTMQYVGSIYMYGVATTLGFTAITAGCAFFFTPYPLALSLVTVCGLGTVASLASFASVWLTPTAEAELVQPN